MSELPADLKYARTHEWVRVTGDDLLTVGISDHAQAELGDLVYVECPEVGRTVAAGEACGAVESVKAASDVYAPVAGEVTAINEALTDSPEHVNTDPYGEGWLFAMRPADAKDIDTLLSADAYRETVEADA